MADVTQGGTLGQLMQTTGSAGPSQQLQQGMQLAQTANSLDAQKASLEQQKEQLDTMKFNKAFDTMHTLATARPEIAKRMVPKVLDQFRSAGIPVDENVMHTMASDDEWKNRWMQVANGIDSTDPAQRAQFMSAMTDMGMTDKGLAQLASSSKLQSQKDIAETKYQGLVDSRGIGADATVQAAEIAAKGRVDAANARIGPNSPQATRVQNQVNSQYQSTMKGWEGSLSAADQLERTIKDVDLGELNSSKNVRGELNAKIASLLGGGKPSTVYGTQSIEQDSLYQHTMDKINSVLGESNSTITDKQWEQMKKEIASFKASNAKMHDDAYQSFREGISESYRQGIDNRFSKFRGSKGLPSSIQYQGDNSGTPPAPVAGAVPQGATLSANQKAFMVKAKLLKDPKTKQPYTDAEIQAMMPKQ